MADEVLVNVEDGIMLVTINRPEAKNAVNLAVALGIEAAMDELETNSNIHVAVITGANNSFCAGMDLKAFVKGEMPIAPKRGFAGITKGTVRKPTIAAVEGYALAGGCEIALACDLIVAAENSKFGIPEVKRGLAAAAGGLMRLPKQIPPRIAMEMAMTGDPIDANRAFDVGLINRVVPAGSTLEEAMKLAKTIAANGPMAVAASKQVLIESQDWTLEDMYPKQKTIIDPVFSSEDAIEGSKAFAEKRAPVWKGK